MVRAGRNRDDLVSGALRGLWPLTISLASRRNLRVDGGSVMAIQRRRGEEYAWHGSRREVSVAPT